MTTFASGTIKVLIDKTPTRTKKQGNNMKKMNITCYIENKSNNLASFVVNALITAAICIAGVLLIQELDLHYSLYVALGILSTAFNVEVSNLDEDHSDAKAPQ